MSRGSSPSTAGAVLEVDDLTKHFRGVTAVEKVSLHAAAGEILGIIGPNGAGKTTLLNLITGFQQQDSGRVQLSGEDITKLRAHAIARKGLTRTFQAPYTFEEETVLENVARALYPHARPSVLSQLRSGRHLGKGSQDIRDRAEALVVEVGLPAALTTARASELPYGHRKLLTVAMALAADPTVLCLDEPAAGLSAAEKENVFAMVQSLRSRGVAILIVEHDMSLIMRLCDRIVVLDHGVRIAEGTPEQVRNDPAVLAAYLGGSHGAPAA
jgi:ABC-type branched-subunit amino acid transport system ATPase component